MLGIYSRLSKDDKDSDSINNQLREGRNFAKSREIKDYIIYNEGEGSSGGLAIKDRPELSRLIEDIEDGKISMVWFRNQNRLERSLFTYAYFMEVVARKKTRVFFGDKEADYNDPDWELQGIILTGINQHQRRLVGKQIKKVLHDNVREGKISRNVCYGYTAGEDKKMVIHEEHAKIVRYIFNEYIKGVGAPTIREEMTKRKIPTINPKTKYWNIQNIYVILKNRTYIGERKWGDEVYPCPAIIDKNTFNRALGRLNDKSNKKQAVKHFYLLNNVLLCGRCGDRMTGRSFGESRPQYYICCSKRHENKVCPAKNVRTDLIDDLIWNSLFKDDTLYDLVRKAYIEGDNEAEKKKVQIDIDHYTGEQEKYSKQLGRIKNMVKEGIYTISEGKKEIQEVESTITKAKDKIGEAKSRMNLLNGERNLLEELEIDMGWAKKHKYLTSTDKEQIKEKLINIGGEILKRSTKETIEKDPIEKLRIVKKYIKSIIVKHFKNREFIITVSFLLPIEDKILELK